MNKELENIKMKIWQQGNGVSMKEIMGDIKSLVEKHHTEKNLVNRLFVAAVEERNNSFKRYGRYIYSPILKEDIIKDLEVFKDVPW